MQNLQEEYKAIDGYVHTIMNDTTKNQEIATIEKVFIKKNIPEEIKDLIFSFFYIKTHPFRYLVCNVPIIKYAIAAHVYTWVELKLIWSNTNKKKLKIHQFCVRKSIDFRTPYETDNKIKI